MPPPPRNPRRTTLGPVSMNSGSTGSSSSSGTPSKIPKPTRKSRQSMLPRVSSGRENNLIHMPPSPSNSVTSSRSMKASSRRSISGGGIGIGSGSGSGIGRKSIGGRFASLGGSNGAGAGSVIKQDPRPISDKAYQQHGIRTLLTYLTKRDYEYPVSIKSLTRPSGKDFQHICTFLLQQMDPTFGTTHQASSGSNKNNSNNQPSSQPHAPKFEEEVALHFKALGYPYPVSKTALVAAGSPHTWPSLLAALVWLVEHIVVIQETGCTTSVDFDDLVGNSKTTAAAGTAAGTGDKQQHQFESLAELDDKTERAFFAYLHKSYAAFLAGNADQSDAYTERLIDMFEQDNMVIEREIERVTDLNGSMVETIHMLHDQSQSLPTLSKKREDYATDLEQFHDLVRQMDDHHAALAQKVEERTTELDQTQTELNKMTGRMENLQIKVNNQQLAVEDVQKMHLEQARLKEALEKVQSLKRFQKEGLWKSQNQLAMLWEDLELLMREYTEEAAELSRWITTLTDKVQWKMALDKDATAAMTSTNRQAQMLGVDLQSELQPFFQQCKDANIQLLGDARRDLEHMLDDLELQKEARTEVTDQSKIIDFKLANLEETLETETEQQEATLQVRLREIESLNSNMELLRDPASLEEQICAYQRQCDQLEALNRKHQEDTVANKRAIQEEIKRALAAIKEYNDHAMAKLQELQVYTMQQKNILVSLKSVSQ